MLFQKQRKFLIPLNIPLIRHSFFWKRCLIPLFSYFLLALIYCKEWSSGIVKANFTTSKCNNPKVNPELLLKSKTGADVYLWNVTTLEAVPYENPQKQRQKTVRRSVWSSSVFSTEHSHPTKWNLDFFIYLFFFDEREIAFPRMLCLVGKAENQLSCHFGKHFISHHLNFWNCGQRVSVMISCFALLLTVCPRGIWESSCLWFGSWG